MAERLNMKKAAAAAMKGKSNAGIAKAAGSRAKTRGALKATGNRLLRRLRERGQIQERATELGIGVEGCLAKLKEKFSAVTLIKAGVQTKVNAKTKARVEEWLYREVEDHGTQLTAVAQIVRMMGLDQVPMGDGSEAEGTIDAYLEKLPDDVLVELDRRLAELQKGGGK